LASVGKAITSEVMQYIGYKIIGFMCIKRHISSFPHANIILKNCVPVFGTFTYKQLHYRGTFIQNGFCLFRYGSETLKQTPKIINWFRKTNQKSTKTGLVSVCFG
jgi:hypothetical protein